MIVAAGPFGKAFAIGGMCPVCGDSLPNPCRVDYGQDVGPPAGGTWAAGRLIARKTRADGGPPFHVVSDGTVF
jgi:hypothetical protein